MSATATITKDNFEDTVRANRMVLLDFWAAWCGPCRFFAPIFEEAAQAHPDIRFGKVDTEAERELAGAFSVSSIPTLVAIKDRTLVYAQPGALPAAALDELVNQLKRLDVHQAEAATGGTAA